MPDTPLSFIQALPDPAHVKVVETHISWVLLAGAFAWKVKKPIKLPFLDYSTVALRRACCEEELRLNRRFAPQLYLDVVDLNGEPAVKMRRFDEALRLDHVCAHCDLTGTHLSAFARDLVAFQATAAVTSAASLFGSAETILADALENFAELEPLLPDAVGHLARIRQWTTAEWARRAMDFASRKGAGRVREGHGDLHLGNLVLLDGRVVPFDGIEFNAGFRNIDVASEIAFTLLDLLDHQRPGLATWLLSEWLVWSGDFAALTVLRFYLVYRAMVRAKVAALQEKRDESLIYLSLAARLAAIPTFMVDSATPVHEIRKNQSTPPIPSLRPGAGGEVCSLRSGDYAASNSHFTLTPKLTITCGLSGCGKTHASSRRLASADFLDTVRIRSDVERKRLFGLAPHDSSAASGGVASTGHLRPDGLPAIYTPEVTTRTYARLVELAECALVAGWSVIVDAAFLKRAERDQFRALAARLGVPFAILAPTAAPEELVRRIALRQNDASEATVAVLEQQLSWFEPLEADEPSQPI